MVLGENVPRDPYIISGSFVIDIKDVETDQPMFKERFIANGNRYSEKNKLVHDHTTVRRRSDRLLLEGSNGIRCLDGRYIAGISPIRQNAESARWICPQISVQAVWISRQWRLLARDIRKAFD